MNDICIVFLDRVRSTLAYHLGDFLLFQTVLFLLALFSRIIIFRKLIDSSNKVSKIEGIYNICSFSLEFGLIGISGIIAATKLPNTILSNSIFVFLSLLLVVLFFLAAIISGFSNRKPKSLFISKDSWLGLHIPNALGFLSFSIAVIVLLGA